MRFTSVIFTILIVIGLTSCNNNNSPTIAEAATAEGTGDCCLPADTSGASGPFNFEILSNEVITSPGDIAIISLVLSHETPSMESINVSLAPVSGQSWRFELCYEDLCFASDGQKTIIRNLSLKSGSSLQIEIKYFIPYTAKSEETMILEFKAESGDSPLVNTDMLMTAKIK